MGRLGLCASATSTTTGSPTSSSSTAKSTTTSRNSARTSRTNSRRSSGGTRGRAGSGGSASPARSSTVRHVARGAAFRDLDNDGRLDAVVSLFDGQARRLAERVACTALGALRSDRPGVRTARRSARAWSCTRATGCCTGWSKAGRATYRATTAAFLSGSAGPRRSIASRSAGPAVPDRRSRSPRRGRHTWSGSLACEVGQRTGSRPGGVPSRRDRLGGVGPGPPGAEPGLRRSDSPRPVVPDEAERGILPYVHAYPDDPIGLILFARIEVDRLDRQVASTTGSFPTHSRRSARARTDDRRLTRSGVTTKGDSASGSSSSTTPKRPGSRRSA